VDENRPRLRGIAAIEVDQAALNPPAQGSWSVQREHWQTQIDTLTDEIRNGLATVTPYEARACQLCHLHAVCRIAARDEDAGADPRGET
jgi:hypothetical protein